MTKITKATIKSFIKKNEGKLFIKRLSDFDGMQDMVIELKDDFTKVVKTNFQKEYTLGIKGAYFVNQSRDYFMKYECYDFIGYEVYNCCGNFILAVEK